MMLALCLALLGAPPMPQARVLTVSPGSALPTLGRALEAARDGDTIRIRPGTYAEPTLTITRRIVILGEGWPVLDAGGDHEMLRVTADSVTIRGLVIRPRGGTISTEVTNSLRAIFPAHRDRHANGIGSTPTAAAACSPPPSSRPSVCGN